MLVVQTCAEWYLFTINYHHKEHSAAYKLVTANDIDFWIFVWIIKQGRKIYFFFLFFKNPMNFIKAIYKLTICPHLCPLVLFLNSLYVCMHIFPQWYSYKMSFNVCSSLYCLKWYSTELYDANNQNNLLSMHLSYCGHVMHSYEVIQALTQGLTSVNAQ